MSTFKLKRKTFGFLGGLTGFSNFNKAATAMTSGAANAGKIARKQALIGTAKLGALSATAYGGKQVFDKMTGSDLDE